MAETRRVDMSVLQRSIGLVAWLAVTYAASAVGAMASADSREFFAQLERPAWAPPGWVFGVVWTILYAMMAIAAWRVWCKRGFAGAKGPLGLFLAQLALNALWTWIFFAWRQGGWALAEIVILWTLIAATIGAFARIDKPAAALLVPYLVWVSFATALTLALWRMNPALL